MIFPANGIFFSFKFIKFRILIFFFFFDTVGFISIFASIYIYKVFFNPANPK